MAWWASGNARSPQGPQTREAARLDRRVLGTTRAGVGPAPSQNVIRATLVLVSGSNAGVFLYSAAPGHGDLVESVSEATSDPFTNPVRPGFGSYDNVFGNSAQLHGAVLSLFTASALAAQLGPNGLSVFNTHGALIYSVDTTRDATFLYRDTGSATQGGLLVSTANASGTDAFGNTYDPGIVSYDPVNAVAVQLFSGVIAVGTFAQFAGTGGALVAHVGLNLTNTVGSLLLTSGKNATADVQATLELDSAGASGVTGGQITATTGKLVAVEPDGNTYRTERLDVALASSFSINSTSPLTIFSASLGVGTYEIDIWGVVLNATAADAASFAFAFTGTATAALVDFTSMTTGTATVGYGASATLTTAFTNQGVAGNQKIEAHLGVTVSVAGTLTFTGKELVAANAVTVFADSRMRVCPV